MIDKGAKWWNDGHINRRSINQPDKSFVLGRIPFPRSSLSKETKDKISSSLKGHEPWNKGKTGVYSEETIAKMKSAKVGYIPSVDNTGRPAWNKGLTASEDMRIFAYAEKQRGQKRQGNYVSNGCWVGEGNPWYGKNRSGENHPSYQPHRHEREYWDFYRKVVRESEKTYAKYIDEINPQGYPRTLCGVEGGYQLDHIKSIDSGWKNKLTVEELSAKENLRIIPWKENRMKGNK